MRFVLVYLTVGLIWNLFRSICVHVLTDGKYWEQRYKAGTYEFVVFIIGNFIGGVLLWPITAIQWLQAFICGIIEGYKESNDKSDDKANEID